MTFKILINTEQEIETAPVSSKGEDDASKGETDDESGDDEVWAVTLWLVFEYSVIWTTNSCGNKDI